MTFTRFGNILVFGIAAIPLILAVLACMVTLIVMTFCHYIVAYVIAGGPGTADMNARPYEWLNAVATWVMDLWEKLEERAIPTHTDNLDD